MRFNMKPSTHKEIRHIVSKSSNKFTPDPNRILFIVYKKCSKVLNWLHANLKQTWNNFHASNQWMMADGVYIPKEKNLKDIGHFHPISFLKVEGKIVFAVLASRLTRFLLINKYIDTSVQKGGVQGIVGCLEHGNRI